MFLLGEESLSLQTLQRKFKNNLKLFRFPPNVAVREVPLSLAGPTAQSLHAISYPKKTQIPQKTMEQHSWQPGRAQHPASALWLSLHSQLHLSSLSELLQSQPSIPALPAFKQPHLEMPS